MKGILQPVLQKLLSALGLGIFAMGISACQPIGQAIEQVMASDARELAREVWSDPSSSSEQYTQDIFKDIELTDIELPTEVDMHFAVVAGGGAPSYNEIALEKNVLYFQRSLRELGFSVDKASLFFASGNDGEETIRYLDDNGDEQFKSAEIPELDGSATLENTYSWFRALSEAEKPCPAFFYFTGHGAYNTDNEDDNALILWEEDLVSVKEFTRWLAPLPTDQPFVTMMAQCYSGAFANLIYEDGDPSQPVALQTRCGFFATVASRPSVGCTPAVNEADYKDYSSSFFAGLTGRDRVGNLVSSADYNLDEKISYAEAHAFAKVDEETTDWPISTVEAWLQRQVSKSDIDEILNDPIDEVRAIARPEQQYVITELSGLIGFDLALSYTDNASRAAPLEPETVDEAYRIRLRMDLINVGAEVFVRANQSAAQIATLDRILECEAGSWQAL
ncbi:hypothetical protein S7335_3170 [Synechococcus sp. PCC 7335]|uniref:hypothetical protein n=1 Tax=Synechococcus sp. (strain ATCC 29403 / PCC 7335) TaxID=91464 RepID=UPI00017EB0A3|nr:hypothetical protein [Synechococcus sp. PCC 7335]EDX85469.1 hypothetical protein S7335_3170 [Synechococcus sp. PCC 7335]